MSTRISLDKYRSSVFGDLRTVRGKRLRDLVKQFARPLGGFEVLDEPARQLVRQAATLAFLRENLEARVGSGAYVDPIEFAAVANALGRILRKLEARRPVLRPPSLSDIAAEIVAGKVTGT